MDQLLDNMRTNSFFDSPLGHALIGLAILIVGLFVIKAASKFIKSGLSKISFLNYTDDDGTTTDFATPIASLIKAVLTIFVLMVVLQYFNLTDVLAPLKEMTTKFMEAIPGIIGAGVIAYAGWIIAKVASQLVKVGLSKIDVQIAEKTGNTDLKISAFGSAFVFIAILLPIAVSALGVLSIPAISQPASAMIQELMTAIPNIIGATVVLLVAYFAAKFVIYLLTSLLDGLGVNAMPEKLGMQGLFTENFTVTKLIGGTVMFFSMLAAATAAVNILGINIISTIFAKVIEFGGGILIGAVILIIGNVLGNIAHQKLTAAGNDTVANIARFAIIGLVLAMGLRAMGLADNIVNMAFGLTLGSVAVAFALAFGLGGRDAAKTITDDWAKKLVKTKK
ncbi:MAG: mechanosensitive ion channel [Methylophagaceae bacterium]